MGGSKKNFFNFFSNVQLAIFLVKWVLTVDERFDSLDSNAETEKKLKTFCSISDKSNENKKKNPKKIYSHFISCSLVGISNLRLNSFKTIKIQMY